MSNPSTSPTNAELEAQVREATEAVTPFKSGRLVGSPLSHLIAYLHKHSMSGTLWLHDVGHDSTVLFADGAPCKVRTSLEVPRLGELLVGMGVIRQRAYDETICFALKGGGLHGGMLVACGLLDQRGLEIGLRNQIGLQLLAIFRTAAPSTWFAFYRDTDLLASWGGPELTPIDPWWLLWRGNREIAPDASVWAILQRLSSERLVLRDDVDDDRFGFEHDERSFLSWWGNHPVTVEQILSYPCLPRGRLARMIEVLFLTRNLSYARPSSRPPASQPSSRPADPRRPSQAVVEPNSCCREALPPSQSGPVSERRGTPSTRMAAVHESVLASVDAVSEVREPERRGTPSELDLAQRSEALRLSERSKKALEEGRVQEAERLAAEALKILPKNAVLKTEYAWVASHLPARRKIGDVGDLIDLLNQATESDPNLDQAYFVRGTIYEYLGLYEKALADFRMALARNRRNQAARERVTEYARRMKELGSLEPGRHPGPSGLGAQATTFFSGLWRRDS